MRYYNDKDKESYDASGFFTEMKDEEVEKLVKECFEGGNRGVRTKDTIISVREGTVVVDVFTIVRHRIYEKVD